MDSNYFEFELIILDDVILKFKTIKITGLNGFDFENLRLLLYIIISTIEALDNVKYWAQKRI
ncbi:MAG: hypothetical protein KKD36_14735 [Bacteroidetes bacterium]|nr:hypothetical protein [Bacteroidota bacterium]